MPFVLSGIHRRTGGFQDNTLPILHQSWCNIGCLHKKKKSSSMWESPIFTPQWEPLWPRYPSERSNISPWKRSRCSYAKSTPSTRSGSVGSQIFHLRSHSWKCCKDGLGVAVGSDGGGEEKPCIQHALMGNGGRRMQMQGGWLAQWLWIRSPDLTLKVMEDSRMSQQNVKL